MNIRVPRFIVVASEALDDWINKTLIQVRGIEVRRIDVLIAALFIFCVSYYTYVAGLRGGLTGALAFTFFLMIGLWFLRK